MTGDDFMLTDEVAGLFRVDAKTVLRWVKAGRFPDGSWIRTLGGHYRFKRADIARLAAGGGLTDDVTD